MIGMIFQIFWDIIGFTLIYVGSMIIFTLLDMNSMKTQDPTFKANGSSFFKAFDRSYDKSHGNWSDFSNANYVRYSIHLISSVFLAIIMLNLIIAVISKTFERFEAKKEIFNTRYMIDILKDHNKFIRYFVFVGKKKKSVGSKEGREAGGIFEGKEKNDFSHILCLRKNNEEEVKEIVGKLREDLEMRVGRMEDKLEEILGLLKNREEGK